MSQIWSCECGNRWRAAGTMRTCPKCGSPKILAVPEPSAPIGPTSVVPGSSSGDLSGETVARPSMVDVAAAGDPSETLAAVPVGLSGSGNSGSAAGAEVTLDRTILPASPTGIPSPAETNEPGTEYLERSGAKDTSPRGAAEPSFATIAAPPSTGGGGDTYQTVGGGSTVKKKSAPRGRSRMEDYEILGVLGRGGMGVVHKARHVKLDRVVALKMILAGSHAGEAQLARFQTEAEAVAQLQHPNIVQIYDIGEHNGQPFIALEFVDGGSLQQKLDGTPMPPRVAAELVGTLARAVDYAHQRGVVHRDLKPANILLGGEWRLNTPEKANGKEIKRKPADPPTTNRIPGLPVPKITDFGLAKRTSEDAGQTGTGDILGTPSYMSPEQATGKNELVGPPADIYSLGAILYDLLTGRPPFKGETVLDTLQQVQGREPLPPTRLQPGVPRDLETICLKCLQKEPGKRYSSAGQLAEDLERFLEYRPIIARPTPWWEHVQKWAKRRPAVAALLATLAFVLTGTFVGMFIMWQVAEGARDAAELARDAEERERRMVTAQRNRAEQNLNLAFGAGEKLLAAISDEPLLKNSAQMESFRRDLLLKAKEFYQKFYAVEGDTPDVRYQVARANRRAGYLLEQLGNSKEARESLEKAVNLLTKLAADSPKSRDYRSVLAGAHIDFAIVLHALDESKQAEREYDTALVLFSKLQEDYPLEFDYQRSLASAYNGLAQLLLHDPNRSQETEQAYQKSLQLWRKLHGDFPKDNEYQDHLARALHNYGSWRFVQGQAQEAEHHYSESLALWTDLVKNNRDNRFYLDGRAGAMINLAALIEQKEPKKAEEYYREAAGVEEKLVRDFSLTADYRYNLAKSYTNLSLLVARDSKRLAEAAKLRQSALPHWEKLVDQNPRSADYLLGLIGCIQSEAQYQLHIGQKDIAVQWGEKEVKRLKDLAAEFPKRMDFRVLLARGYLNLGELLGANGKIDLEQQNYREAMLKLGEIQDNAPPGWTQVMADVHCNLGGILAQGKDFQKAIKVLPKGVTYQQEALAENPGNYEAQKKLAHIALMAANVQVIVGDHAAVSDTAAAVAPSLKEMKWAKGESLHQMARFVVNGCANADKEEHQKYADQTVQLLEAAVAQGFANAKALRDPVFAALKGRADYEQLLKSLGKG